MSNNILWLLFGSLLMWGAIKLLIPTVRRKLNIRDFKKKQSSKSGFGLIIDGKLLTTPENEPFIFSTLDEVYEYQVSLKKESTLIWQNWTGVGVRVNEVQVG